jgi:hypothetical protein
MKDAIINSVSLAQFYRDIELILDLEMNDTSSIFEYLSSKLDEHRGAYVALTGNDHAQYAVGDAGPAGGVVFYDKGHYSDGWRYLEAAIDADIVAPWAPIDYEDFSVCSLKGLRVDIGTGKKNTEIIMEAFNDNFCAANACNIYEFKDWFLPSIDELSELDNYLYDSDFEEDGDGVCFWSSSNDSDYMSCIYITGLSKDHVYRASKLDLEYPVFPVRSF